MWCKEGTATYPAAINPEKSSLAPTKLLCIVSTILKHSKNLNTAIFLNFSMYLGYYILLAPECICPHHCHVQGAALSSTAPASSSCCSWSAQSHAVHPGLSQLRTPGLRGSCIARISHNTQQENVFQTISASDKQEKGHSSEKWVPSAFPSHTQPCSPQMNSWEPAEI